MSTQTKQTKSEQNLSHTQDTISTTDDKNIDKFSKIADIPSSETSANTKASDLQSDPQENLECLDILDIVSFKTPDILSERYKFIKEIGNGTQGHIYLARRLADQKNVAIKELRIDSVKNWKAYDLFKREANVLATLKMKGVAQFYEAIEALEADPPAAYLVQEYIEGRSLDDMLRTGYRFTIAQVFSLAVKWIDLLDRLHHHNPPIIHRDIKPSNIMLCQSQSRQDPFDIYLIDFGAVANPQVQGGGSTVAGTYGYMPPEQLTGNPVPASDIYSLAAMLAYMLSGVSPAKMEVSDFRLVIDNHLENVPRTVVFVLQQMLEPNPTKRLADHNVLTTIFREFAREHFEPAHLPTLVLNVLSQQTEMSRWRFRQRLRRVKRICATGNLDLWMRLPEKTPRQMWFPQCIAKYHFNIAKNDISKCLVYLTNPFQNFIYLCKSIFALENIKRNAFSFILIASIFITIIPIIALPFILESDTSLGENLHAFLKYLSSSPPPVVRTPFGNIELKMVFAILYCAPFIISMSYFKLTNKPFKLYDKPININNREFHMMDQYGFTKYSYIAQLCYLLLHGRKTIATVVAIEYIYPKRTYLPYRLQSTDHIMPKYHACESPCFCIRYKFNPPDDSEADAIIHEIFLDNDIQSSLNLGSPLPILYAVHPENIYVSSMPFPLPKHSFNKTRTYCCVTCRGENVSHIYDDEIPLPF